MKKLTLFLSLIVAASMGFCDDMDYLQSKSCFTTTNDTLVNVSTYMAGGIFHGVIIGSNTPSGIATFYDSNGVKTSTIAVVSMATSGGAAVIPFDIRVSTGLTYSITGNTSSGLVIIYRIVKPVNP